MPNSRLIVDPLWRNWLARQTVNLEVGSSSLPGGVTNTFFLVHLKSTEGCECLFAEIFVFSSLFNMRGRGKISMGMGVIVLGVHDTNQLPLTKL